MEESFGPGHGEQGADAHGAGGLAEDCDIAGISPEGGDVLVHPLQGGDLVEQPDVGDAVPEVEEALGAGPPIDHDADDAVPSEVPAVVGGRRAELEHAALDPHHHRQPGRTRVRRPDIQIQTLLGGRGAIDRRERAGDVLPILGRSRTRATRGRRSHLRRLRTGTRRVPHAAPRLDRLRRTKPVRTERRRRVRDSQEGVDALGNTALQLAVRRLDHRIHAHQRSATRNVAEESKVPDISVSTDPKPFRCTACGARRNPSARSPRVASLGVPAFSAADQIGPVLWGVAQA